MISNCRLGEVHSTNVPSDGRPMETAPVKKNQTDLKLEFEHSGKSLVVNPKWVICDTGMSFQYKDCYSQYPIKLFVSQETGTRIWYKDEEKGFVEVYATKMGISECLSNVKTIADVKKLLLDNKIAISSSGILSFEGARLRGGRRINVRIGPPAINNNGGNANGNNNNANPTVADRMGDLNNGSGSTQINSMGDLNNNTGPSFADRVREISDTIRISAADHMRNINNNNNVNSGATSGLNLGFDNTYVPPVVFDMEDHFLNTTGPRSAYNIELQGIADYIRGRYASDLVNRGIHNGERSVVFEIQPGNHPLWRYIRLLGGHQADAYFLRYVVTYENNLPVITVEFFGGLNNYSPIEEFKKELKEFEDHDPDEDEKEEDRLNWRAENLSNQVKKVLNQINNNSGSNGNQQYRGHQVFDIHNAARIIEYKVGIIQVEKVAYKTFQKKILTAQTALKLATAALEKIGLKISAKIAADTGKSAGKKIPLIGLFAGVAFGIGRAFKNDWEGFGMELASGAASTVPFVGTAASLGIDTALIFKDIQEEQEEQEKKQRKAQEEYDEAVRQSQESARKIAEANEEIKAQTGKILSLYGSPENEGIISLELLNELKAINEEMEEIQNKLIEIQKRRFNYDFFLAERYLHLALGEYHHHFQAFYKNCKPKEFIEELNEFLDSLPSDKEYNSRIIEFIATLFIVPTRYVLRKDLNKILKKTKMIKSQINQVIECSKFHENNKLKLMTDQVDKHNHFYVEYVEENSIIIRTYKNILLSSMQTDQFITASRALDFESETFKITSLEDDYVTIQRNNDHYLSARGTTGDFITFQQKQSIEETEKFKMEKWGFDKVCFQASNGLYLGVELFQSK